MKHLLSIFVQTNINFVVAKDKSDNDYSVDGRLTSGFPYTS